MTVSWEAVTQRILESARVAVYREVGAWAAEALTLEPRMLDRVGESMGMTLATRLLREQLPAEHIVARVRVEHVEAVGERAWTTDLRFAGPRDAFVAKYRTRWWARLLGSHWWPVEYVEVPVPFRNQAAVSCDHEVTLTVRGAWTYPKPSVPPPMNAGYAVYQHDETLVSSRPVPGEADPWR